MNDSATTADAAPVAPKPKKSVALSGVTAGNTALCTVGRTGNDLHYRGYDILDIADACEFEEIAYLLVHGKLPNAGASSPATRPSSSRCAACRPAVQGGAGSAAGRRPSDGRDAHRRVRAGLRAAGEGRPQPSRRARHRRPADGLASARCCSTGITSATTAGASRSRPTTTPSAGISCTCCTARRRSAAVGAAMHTSLILYAEHEFNASTFTCRVDRRHRLRHVLARSPAASARCAAPSTAAPTRSRSKSRSATTTPDEAEADIAPRVANKEVIIGFGHPVYTIADPRNEVIKEVARKLSEAARRHEDVRHRRAASRAVMWRREEDVPEPRLVLRRVAIT